MTQYLLDTNIASYIIKGLHPAIPQRLVSVPIHQVAISSVTEGELRYGVARLPAASRLNAIVEEFLIRIVIRPWDSAAAQEYGRIRAALESRGHTLGNLDLMIAAHALALGSVLVTHDKAFARIKGMKIEDWTRSQLTTPPRPVNGK
ncbi:Ribonuclease VapC [Candidatus Sulfopaludibacter sp. SbA3]|nr:Ribonuclease VapC [Candidatus Sulfopaludibacter sp. SbA3]